jgi:hypothetical protein
MCTCTKAHSDRAAAEKAQEISRHLFKMTGGSVVKMRQILDKTTHRFGV